MYYSESSNLNSEQLLILILESTNDSSFHPIWLLSRHKYKNYVRIKMTRSVNSQQQKAGKRLKLSSCGSSWKTAAAPAIKFVLKFTSVKLVPHS